MSLFEFILNFFSTVLIYGLIIYFINWSILNALSQKNIYIFMTKDKTSYILFNSDLEQI